MLRRAALLAVALAIAAAPAALADGDPASDVLPAQDAYFPYSPPVSKALTTTLTKLLARVRAAGYPMKVALIESASDLGSYAQLFNDPQRYANLLAGELPTQADRRVSGTFHLLVVMPGGFGGENLGDGVNRALDPVTIDATAGSEGLARAAIVSVARLASVNGHPTPVPAGLTAAHGGGSPGGGGTSALAIVIPLAVLLAAAATAGVLLRRRRSAAPGGE